MSEWIFVILFLGIPLYFGYLGNKRKIGFWGGFKAAFGRNIFSKEFGIQSVLKSPMTTSKKSKKIEQRIIEESDLVTVASFDNVFKANLILEKLQANNISAVLLDENMGNINSIYRTAVGGVKVQVLKNDELNALNVIAKK